MLTVSSGTSHTLSGQSSMARFSICSVRSKIDHTDVSHTSLRLRVAAERQHSAARVFERLLECFVGQFILTAP